VPPGEYIPVHTHGSSKYYRDLGCLHPLCVAKASMAKAANRARRRAERVKIDGRMVHPDLAAADSDSPRRHGTRYARTTFGCECLQCKYVPAAFPGTLMWQSHLDSRVAAVVFAAATVVVLWRTIPAHDVPRHLAALARTAHLPVGCVVSIVLIIAATRAKRSIQKGGQK
jgi:hypothetical protein